MPMLTTVRMRWPVCPVHCPERTRVGEVGHPVEHRVHVRDHVLPVDDQRASRGSRSAMCSTARSSLVLMCSPGEHRVDALAQPGSLGQRESRRIVSAGDRCLE